jgi:hypothetical protein
MEKALIWFVGITIVGVLYDAIFERKFHVFRNILLGGGAGAAIYLLG